MNRLVIEISPELNEALATQVKTYGKSATEYARQLIETGVRRTAKTFSSGQAMTDAVKDRDAPYDVLSYSTPSETMSSSRPKTVREYLEEAGMVVGLGDELRSMIIPGVTLEEVQQILADAGGPSLTEILDEHRGPKG